MILTDWFSLKEFLFLPSSFRFRWSSSGFAGAHHACRRFSVYYVIFNLNTKSCLAVELNLSRELVHWVKNVKMSAVFIWVTFRMWCGDFRSVWRRLLMSIVFWHSERSVCRSQRHLLPGDKQLWWRKWQVTGACLGVNEMYTLLHTDLKQQNHERADLSTAVTIERNMWAHIHMLVSERRTPSWRGICQHV